MKTAILRYAPVAALVLCLGVPAFAQSSNVTFQVDMSVAIENCAFNVDTSVASVNGTFNGWTAEVDILTHAGDGIYSGTFEIENGEHEYKFWASDPLGWEDADNRHITVDGDVVLDIVPYGSDIDDFCEAEEFQIYFEVDMSVQVLSGNFNPDTDVVWVAGDAFNWGPGPDDTQMFLDVLGEDPHIYTAAITRNFGVPSTNGYKFIIEDENGTVFWESGDNRTFNITGNEPNNIVEVPRRYFNDAGPDDVLQEETVFTLVVDLRAAYYFLADEGFLHDEQSSEQTHSVNGLAINGDIPFASLEDTAPQWAGWGPDALGQIESRQFFDDGTNGDAVAGDSLWTRQYTYPAGTPRTLIGKFGVEGYDNEASFGNDQHLFLIDGETTAYFVFGCMRRADGTYNANSGPGGFTYQPYLQVVNAGEFSTCTVVRSGGTTGVESTGRVPEGFSLSPNFPNPVYGITTFEYSVAEAGHVSLEVFDITGRRVAVLVDDVQSADTYRVTFETTGLASGTYIYRLVANGQSAAHRMSVVR